MDFKDAKPIGIRELKARLSACLHEVRAGSSFLVTDRGRIVAELRPHREDERTAESGAGYLRDPFRGPPAGWASQQADLVEGLRRYQGGSAPAGTAQQLIDWDRAEKL